MYQRPDRWLYRATQAAHRSARPRRRADFQTRRRIPVWQLGLAASAAMALLGGLLWLAPWQGRHAAPITAPQALPTQDGARTARAAGETAAPAVSIQIPQAETPRAEHDAPSPALLTPLRETSGEAPARQPATAPQAMQESLPWPGTVRHTHEEQLDTQAMDNLLSRLASADKPPLPTASRSKVARKKAARTLPRVSSAGRRTPGFVVSPRRPDSAWPGPRSASRRSFTPEPSDSTE